MIPGTNKVFNGSLMPDAPTDIYAALGKDGQILNITPSEGIIVVRMGERPDEQFFISKIFNNDIWKYLNEIMDGETSVGKEYGEFGISPNPASEYIEINLERWSQPPSWTPSNSEEIKIYNAFGIEVGQSSLIDIQNSNIGNVSQAGMPKLLRMDISDLPAGMYFIKIGNYIEKFMVMR